MSLTTLWVINEGGTFLPFRAQWTPSWQNNWMGVINGEKLAVEFAVRIWRVQDDVLTELTMGPDGVVTVSRGLGIREFSADVTIQTVDLGENSKLRVRVYWRWQGDPTWREVTWDKYIQSGVLPSSIKLSPVWKFYYYVSFEDLEGQSQWWLFFGSDDTPMRAENVYEVIAITHTVTLDSSPIGVPYTTPSGVAPFTVMVNDGASLTVQAPPEIEV